VLEEDRDVGFGHIAEDTRHRRIFPEGLRLRRGF
jgi:hypothetical protein